MDIVDRELVEAERDASPDQFKSLAPKPLALGQVSGYPKIEQTKTTLSTPTSSSDGSVTYREIGVGRVPSGELEMGRFQTARSQHSGTVGVSRIGTWRSRDSKLPLPNFGGGKPFPPLLPDQEQYVVEFDGRDDPLHAQKFVP